MRAGLTSSGFLVGLVSLGLCACFSGPRLAPDSSDQQAKAFVPSDGKAAIYVFRHSRGRGYRVPIPLSIDGQRFGVIASKTYYVVEVEPGSHEVWLGWGPEEVHNAKLIPLAVNVVAGQTYFVRAGTISNESHKTVDALTGKKELLSCCKLAAPPVRASSSLFK